MLEFLKNKIGHKRVVILGFGMEGQSSLRYLLSQKYQGEIFVLDKNDEIGINSLLSENQISYYGGENYLNKMNSNDFIIKSPGVKIDSPFALELHSQTSLFLEAYHTQVIGITGTKGKSTTATMMNRLLLDQNKKSYLVGNIGQPAFDLIDKINEDTYIVYELSAHQLQCVKKSPKHAILLNLMPEHLDYFLNKKTYYLSKLNIIKYQNSRDFYYMPAEAFDIACHLMKINPRENKSKILQEKIYYKNEEILKKEDLKYLLGQHHITNIQGLIELVLYLKLDLELALESIKTFHPLPHRQELLGNKNGIRFINDSISTIPQSAIHAIKAIEKVEYLILGGYDRGINYDELTHFLQKTTLKEVFYLGKAGKRMLSEYKKSYGEPIFKYTYHEKLADIKEYLLQIKTGTVLLSPAAASYDSFKNFEERGNYFKQIFLEI